MKNVVSFNICTILDHINDIRNAEFHLKQVFKIYQELVLQISEKRYVSRNL